MGRGRRSAEGSSGASWPDKVRLVAFILNQGDDLRTSIEAAVEQHDISAGTIISGVGPLTQVHMRMAGTGREDQDIHDFKGEFEIVSLIGNVGSGRTHIHISVADSSGKVIGGHVKSGGKCIVGVTAKIVIAVEDSLRFIENLILRQDGITW